MEYITMWNTRLKSNIFYKFYIFLHNVILESKMLNIKKRIIVLVFNVIKQKLSTNLALLCNFIDFSFYMSNLIKRWLRFLNKTHSFVGQRSMGELERADEPEDS